MAHANNPGSLLDAAQAHAIALAMYNAVNAQQQGAIVRQATTTMACAAMLSLGVAEAAEAAPQPPAAAAAEAASAAHDAPLASELAAAAGKVPPVLAVEASGVAGNAYQSVAQSTALAIQDAADNLRNISTIVTTATGVAMAQYLANPQGEQEFAAAMAATQQIMAAAVANFEAIGASAEQLLKTFPSA